MKIRKSTEEQAIVLMKLLSNWINFYLEMKEEEVEDEGVCGVDFGIMQIDSLQGCLERLKQKLKKEQK